MKNQEELNQLVQGNMTYGDWKGITGPGAQLREMLKNRPEVERPPEPPKTDMLVVTLTDSPPVRIVKTNWPIIASASKFNGELEMESDRRWRLLVRRNKKSGRAIVYGVYLTRWKGESDRRVGRLLDAGSDIPQAIRQVAEELTGSTGADIAQECIASLPPVDID